MASFFSRPGPERRLSYRLGWGVAMGSLWFVGGTVALTLAYRFVPPPVTMKRVVPRMTCWQR